MVLPVLSKQLIEKAIKAKGYKWFEDKLNIVGIRTSDMKSNTFNDYITVSYKDKTGNWKFIGFECTTDPGLYHLKNPSRVKGTAILVPNQYIDTYRLGIHSGYEALVQDKLVAVYRDNNRDEYLNMDNKFIEVGYFGINIHRAHLTVLQYFVEKYSAGCQVIRNILAWWKFMEIIKNSKQTYFTYTLITENDLK